MISKNEANDKVLDLYDRQRRIICERFVQKQTIENKKLLEEKDPYAQQKAQEKYNKTASNPELCKQFLIRTSMIDSVRESYKIN